MELDKTDLDWICTAMNTDKDGTNLKDFYPMVRPFFYLLIRRKFSKKFMDKWLEREGCSVIIDYCTDKKKDEWHVANIFKKKDGIYYGANFYCQKKGYYFHKTTEDFVKRLYNRKGGSIIYLRSKDV
jgi:hypothetical protein